MGSILMVVRYFDLECVSTFPFKGDPPLLIDPDAVKSGPIAAQFFQMVRWRNPQIIDILRAVDHPQFPSSNMLNILRQLFGGFPLPHSFGLPIPETVDHDE